jgi:hypothetical protein
MAQPATPGLASRLLGTWALQSYEARSVAHPADVIHPLGSEPRGFIIYAADGYMSTQMMRADRPQLVRPDLHSSPSDELAVAASGYLGYGGPFSIDGDVVIHHIAVSLMPNWIGHDHRRTPTFDGPVLTLTAVDPMIVESEARIFTLSWRRH